MRRSLAALSLVAGHLVASCSAATPTPQIIYVTPAPTAVSEPTPVPTPVPTATARPTPMLLISQTNNDVSRPFLAGGHITIVLNANCTAGVSGSLLALQDQPEAFYRFPEHSGSVEYDVPSGAYSIFVIDPIGCTTWGVSVYQDPAP